MLINCDKDRYTIQDCTVAELIEVLRKLDPELPVRAAYSGGTRYSKDIQANIFETGIDIFGIEDKEKLI